MMQDYAYSKSDIGELDDSFFVKVPMDDDEEEFEDDGMPENDERFWLKLAKHDMSYDDWLAHGFPVDEKEDIGEAYDAFWREGEGELDCPEDEEDEEDENDRVLGKIRGEIYFAELDNDDFPW